MITQWVMMGSKVGRISMIHQVGVTVEWLGEHLGETQFFYYDSLVSRMLRLIPAEQGMVLLPSDPNAEEN